MSTEIGPRETDISVDELVDGDRTFSGDTTTDVRASTEHGVTVITRTDILDKDGNVVGTHTTVE